MKTILELPMLYGECRTGKTKVYRVTVTDNGDGSFSALREHGQLGGAMQVDEKRIAAGKRNLSPADQAIAEAKAYWKKKLDANYSQTLNNEAPKANLLPMLAQPYEKSKHRMKFPAYGQMKLNGVRCMVKRTGNAINFTSRKGKSYNETLQHLVPAMFAMLQDGEVFDGEIYIHGKTLQTIVSYVKKLRPESRELQYWIYDMGDATKTFAKRYATYSSIIPDNHPMVFAVPCVEIPAPEAIKPAHDYFVGEGYEGLILRNKDGLYTFDHRSADLQKVKEFMDDEFEIIGGSTPETGRYAGCCVFLCKTKEGKTFEATPRGTVAIRQQYYADLPQLIGRMLTVRFFNYTDDGIPFHPVGICVRDYE